MIDRTVADPAHCRPRRTRTAAAFTLIELLMVVSIIALLIAILMPALNRAKVVSSQTTCQANMSGMGLALQTYLAEYDNSVPLNGILFPKPGGRNTAPTTGYDGNGDPNPQDWDLPHGVLWDYMNKNRKSYICGEDYKNNMVRIGANTNLPLQRDPTTGIISVGPSSLGYWSYSVNSVLNSQGQFRANFLPRGQSAGATTQQPWIDPLKWTSVARPSDFFVFIEEDANSPFNDEVFDAPAYNGGDKLTDRHNRGGNVAFGDRHVEWFSDVLFNQAPPAGSGASQDNWTALQYPITRDFFPDGGTFATPLP